MKGTVMSCEDVTELFISSLLCGLVNADLLQGKP